MLKKLVLFSNDLGIEMDEEFIRFICFYHWFGGEVYVETGISFQCL